MVTHGRRSRGRTAAATWAFGRRAAAAAPTSAAAPLPAGAQPSDLPSQPLGDGDLGTARSVQYSEAQLLARCTAAVEQCRADLADLRAVCKGAVAHREKCAELLGAATEAVVALEDLLYDPDIDLARERALQQLATKVQASMDQVGAGCCAGC